MSLVERIELRSALVWRRDCWELIHRHWAVEYHDAHRDESERLLAVLDGETAHDDGVVVPMSVASVACLEAAAEECAASGEVNIRAIGGTIRQVARAVRAAMWRV